MANKKNKKEKIDKKALYTRILCLFLAFMMLASGLFVIIEALL